MIVLLLLLITVLENSNNMSLIVQADPPVPRERSSQKFMENLILYALCTFGIVDTFFKYYE